MKPTTLFLILAALLLAGPAQAICPFPNDGCYGDGGGTTSSGDITSTTTATDDFVVGEGQADGGGNVMYVDVSAALTTFAGAADGSGSHIVTTPPDTEGETWCLGEEADATGSEEWCLQADDELDATITIRVPSDLQKARIYGSHAIATTYSTVTGDYSNNLPVNFDQTRRDADVETSWGTFEALNICDDSGLIEDCDGAGTTCTGGGGTCVNYGSLQLEAGTYELTFGWTVNGDGDGDGVGDPDCLGVGLYGYDSDTAYETSLVMIGSGVTSGQASRIITVPSTDRIAGYIDGCATITTDNQAADWLLRGTYMQAERIF